MVFPAQFLTLRLGSRSSCPPRLSLARLSHRHPCPFNLMLSLETAQRNRESNMQYDYSLPVKVIKITQFITVVLSIIGAILTMAMICVPMIKIGETSGARNMSALGLGSLYSSVVLVSGALVWSFLYGILALFEIAENTRS
jgi:hypothetical protein